MIACQASIQDVEMRLDSARLKLQQPEGLDEELHQVQVCNPIELHRRDIADVLGQSRAVGGEKTVGTVDAVREAQILVRDGTGQLRALSENDYAGRRARI